MENDGEMLADSQRFVEDLQACAQYTFELANRRCGDCVDYHALRPYLRLAGVVNGLAGHAATLRPILRDLLANGKENRILIAGAADTGILAFVADAAAEAVPEIVVIDRCPTPLELCRRFAENKPFSVETRQQGLEEIEDVGRFDIILCHQTLSFVSSERRSGVLEKLHRALRADGKLLLVYKENKPIESGIDEYETDYSQRTLSVLERLQVTLPEPRQELLARLRRYARTYFRRRGAPVGPAKLESLLRAAGFAVMTHKAIGARLSVLNETRTEYVVIAKRSEVHARA